MSISEKIKNHLMPQASSLKVKDVRIGLGYTAVMLANGQTGVAFTFHDGMKKGCTIFSGRHPLAGCNASDLLAYLGSKDRVEMAVALATANAIANKMNAGFVGGDTLEHVPINPGDRVGMVGYFGPVLPRLKKKTSSILVFEQIKKVGGDIFPEEDAYLMLPECDVALITSTSILNHTIDRLLESVKGCREVVLLGASTPLLPEIFENTAVTFLSGIIVTRPEEILRIVSEGAGMRHFKNNVKKVNARVKRAIGQG
ncbi:MAG: DUF364 domain-containing protein [Deltaproteobacteria bacterium]|nr:DUF364 domain-containing protein [Deltaproteobacteria bacterium]MBW1934984.1 DUF364 domain-containing protein [Deltaproteobacteria bacterium]MBW1977872.1 DUF364 domain-containing protein [Deltaproteobacteria bacterium]MBW2046406.1 DUF364 domain-containing protein [Deltaproteobacteria bacterium]MBW2300610.1 DUF364 domain-containing protein [Deltaproteobacteria bacterium]